MRGVLAGFAAIWVVTLVGYLIGRFELLGPAGPNVLARLVFFVAAPALLLTTLVRSSPGEVFTGALAAFVLSTVLAAGAYLAVTALVHRGRDGPDAGTLTVGTLAASYVNAGNLGIPVAAYVLGDVSFIAPVLLFQTMLAAPIGLAVLDVTTGGRRPSPRALAMLPLRSPLTLASAVGIAVAATGWRPPEEVMRPIDLVASAAVPMALLALGMSLPGSRPFAAGRDGWDRYTAVALKVVGQPLLAYLIGRHALGLHGPPLLAAVVTAALPTAQNVFVFASRYDRAVGLARDAIVLSTVAAAATLVLIAAWLG
ncbi:AEC family transporter [Phytohabitans suffuscus]|uniref:Membrane protein n=1 Tax=Phytohabitans suffuscus TaxID=624315 RepID=A0A6F8YVM0_9ACTN|nr:AEC family transporter [Phytohabitans suffuscus]BCB90187.1 membrane protein [Phytohabitans suffuscus]